MGKIIRDVVEEATNQDGRYKAYLNCTATPERTDYNLRLVDRKAGFWRKFLGNEQKIRDLGGFVKTEEIDGDELTIFVQPENLRFDKSNGNVLLVDVYNLFYNNGNLVRKEKKVKRFNVPLIFA